MKKLAIISTHPIQYYAPVFRRLQALGHSQIRVFYTWSQAAHGAQFDPGFNQTVRWDIPLLDGYDYEFVENCASRPGVDHFRGVRNPTLWRRISDWGADALLVFGWNLHGHLQVMRRAHGKRPVFFRGDSTLLDAQPAARRWLRQRVLRWVYRHVDVAIAVGRNSADYFHWCGIPRERIAVAPHSVENERFEQPDAAQDALVASWRAQLKLGHDERAIVYAGKLIPKKDVGLLLHAFERLQQKAHLVIFGSGEQEVVLREQAATIARVHFMPFQNQASMPAVYRLADVFVLPSCRNETWGLALNEAMASARPVIASSKVGASRDLVRDGVTGWEFAAGDGAALSHTLERALSLSRDELRTVGEQARAHVHAFSSDASARGIADAVDRFA